MAQSGFDPRQELNGLFHDTAEMAARLLEKDGSHRPFAYVIDLMGKLTLIAADDTLEKDNRVLEAAVLRDVSSGCKRPVMVRAVAYARNITCRFAPDGPLIPAVEITVDHIAESPATVVLSYELGPERKMQYGEPRKAPEPSMTFFSAENFAAARPADNQPLQRTGAAGIVSKIAKWFGRGPGH